MCVYLKIYIDICQGEVQETEELNGSIDKCFLMHSFGFKFEIQHIDKNVMEIPNCMPYPRQNPIHVFNSKTAKESKVKPINLLNLARPQIRETWPSLSSKL